MSTIAQITAQIASTDDAETLVPLYKELVSLMVAPKKRYKDMSTAEKVQFRLDRKAKRDAGLIQGRTLTPEQKAARIANRTPEKLLATAQKREATQAAKVAKQIAMENRLAELEAIVTGNSHQASGKRR